MQQLSHRTRWLYGAGDLGFSLTSTIIGAYFAFFLTDVVGIKPATAAIAIFIGYISLPNSAQQPVSAINGIRIVTGPIPAVLLCAGILFAALYPLERENYTEIVQKLETTRNQGTGRIK